MLSESGLLNIVDDTPSVIKKPIKRAQIIRKRKDPIDELLSQ